MFHFQIVSIQPQMDPKCVSVAADFQNFLGRTCDICLQPHLSSAPVKCEHSALVAIDLPRPSDPILVKMSPVDMVEGIEHIFA